MTALARKATFPFNGRTRRCRSGLRRAGYTLVVIGLSVTALALAAAVAPRLAGFEGLAITSGSMGKAAPTGSLVLTRDRPASEVKPGDVIVIERPEHPIVVHRVVSVGTSEGTLVAETKGDANPTPDPDPYPLPVEVPVMAWSLPLVGHLVSLLQRPLGWLLLIVMPATAVTVGAVRDLWRKEGEPKPAAEPVSVDVQPVLAEAAVADADAAGTADPLTGRLPAGRAEAADDAENRPAAIDSSGEEAFPELVQQLDRVKTRAGVIALPGAEPETSTEATIEATEPTWRGAPPTDTIVPEAEVTETAMTVGAMTERADVAAVSLDPAPRLEPVPHLVYVTAGAGYRLVECDGEVPRAGDTIEANGRTVVVLRVGASPLPGDRRRCVFAMPIGPS